MQAGQKEVDIGKKKRKKILKGHTNIWKLQKFGLIALKIVG